MRPQARPRPRLHRAAPKVRVVHIVLSPVDFAAGHAPRRGERRVGELVQPLGADGAELSRFDQVEPGLVQPSCIVVGR